MRERQKGDWLFGNLIRITPACAGKTRAAELGIAKREDHPRVCGKDKKYHKLRSDIVGSPPRVRERHSGNIEEFADVRITPACAGKTSP